VLREARRLGPDDLFLLNSTSGTTGLPKCVTQHQNRWWYFHQLAADAGQLSSDDVFMSVIPAPFGFGLWTAHFSPAYLGVPTVLMPRFSARGMIDLIERHRVTVLCCVSTQFIMLLNEQVERRADLTSLRAMFTGGEAVPYERAAEFERTTGASVLQFYGSNETGALSRTTHRDTRDQRLRTAGQVIPEMHVRLLDEDGADVTGERGQPACKGPATCMGYYRDERANEQLFTPDGWMRTGDIAEIDADGYLSVVGRVSDFIIRGGKNISAVQVEDEIGSHPGVAMVAVVGMPDPVFGEKVCAYVVPRPGVQLTLDAIVSHLAGRGLGKELFPERLEVVDALEAASGGKVAKQVLRDDIKRKLEAGS
jgi:acyl-CoA synthetase